MTCAVCCVLCDLADAPMSSVTMLSVDNDVCLN